MCVLSPTWSRRITADAGRREGGGPRRQRSQEPHRRAFLFLVASFAQDADLDGGGSQVSGIAKFARSKGIPYSEALLQVASMGLNKILDALPEEVENEVEETILDEAQRRRRQEQQQASTGRGGVREMDAAELERQSTPEATAEAKRAGKLGADMGDHPKVEGENDDGKCIVS